MQAEAAHICYTAAGVLPQPWTPSAQFCLPGTDHRAHPRTFASIGALQASDILEWLMCKVGQWASAALAGTLGCLLQAMVTGALNRGRSASRQ